jgi:glutamate 5-kinase
MLSADYLFLMTDVDCLYTANPRRDPNAVPIEVVTDVSVLEADVSSSGSDLGTGGMSTKIVAAKLATSAGVITVITQSSKPGNVAEIVAHCEALRKSESPETVPAAPLHTRFMPLPERIRDRSFWLLHGLAPHGTIYIDEGAYRALKDKAGLLPVGIVDVEGNFSQQEAVRLVVVRRRSLTMNLINSDDSLPTDDGKDSPSNGSKSGSRSSLARGGIAVYESLSSFDAPPPTTPLTSEVLSGFHTPSISTSGEPSLLVPIAESVEALTTPAPDSFERKDPAPREVGRALVNYAATEIARIKGLKSRDIPLILGYADSDYVALRENVSLFSDSFITTAPIAS